MQAELLGLEMTVDELRQNEDLNGFNTSWIGPPRDTNQVVATVYERVRVLLDQYCEAFLKDVGSRFDCMTDRTLLQTARLDSLEKPPCDSFELLQRWYDSDEEKGGQAFLQGIEEAVFRDSRLRGRLCGGLSSPSTDFDSDDLMSLYSRPGKGDAIATFIEQRLLPVYDRIVGHRLHRSKSFEVIADTREYQMKALILIGNTICMLLSATMPALAILVLFHVKSTLSRLVAVVFLSLAFSVVMTVVAQRKSEIFMATTAFAAVLVVFVGSANDID